MKKLNISDKKTNIIITSVILALALAAGIVVAVDFISFRNYETYFNTDLVDEIQHFVDYSPNLKGTVGAETAIYIKYGAENTVALVKKTEAGNYDTAEKINNGTAAVYGVAGSSQLAAAAATLTSKTITGVPSAEAAVSALKDGTCDVAVVGYAEAKAAISADSSLVISEAEVEAVPSMLILGGTHPNEPAGQIASVVILENVTVERGVLYVITEANRSGYTHTHPQEASPEYYNLTAKDGSERTFKFGSRASNTVDQWPTPDIYSHNPSGQPLSASEVRNLNRAYPGVANGNYTERVAYAITQLIVQNNITITIDLHEASPEYSNINQGVYHQAAEDLTGMASMYAEMEGMEGLLFSQSPRNLHGLTHRELGDYTNTLAYLFETSNASQGKYRGAFTESLIITGDDKLYNIIDASDKADNDKSNNLLYAAPVHINERVARHVCSVKSLALAFNDDGGKERATADGNQRILGELLFSTPSYSDLITSGVSNYLASGVSDK